MSAFRFPFNWGSVPDAAASVSTTTAGASADRWAKVTASNEAWNRVSGAPQVRRFERIYAQPTNVFGQSVNFSHHVASQFPHLIQTGSQVVVISTITNP